MSRLGPVALVALLVVLAGCSGVFGDGGETTSTVTPAAVPTDRPTATPVPSLAPGLTGAGIENASALVVAHESYLRTHSFTQRTNATGIAPNGTAVVEEASTLRAGPPGTGAYYVAERTGRSDGRVSSGLPTRTEIWSTGKRAFLNRTYANGTSARDREPIDRRLGTTGARLQSILAPFENASTSVTREDHDGTTFYLVRGNVDSEAQGHLHVELLVDGRGLIHRYRTVQESTSGTTSRFTSVTRLTRLGATHAPPRPAWVDAAGSQSTLGANDTATARG